MTAAARLRAALAGRYTLVRELGHGGMATVYLADDVKHGRPVALKVLRPEVAAALGPERFRREVEIVARLSHPHILALFDSGDAGGFLYYAMPYVSGETLRARLAREPQLPLDDALAITRGVAAALDFAHARNVVHRDVKPENILIHEGEAMLADFGIALVAGALPHERLTEAGLALGTPAYMSPEQSLGEAALDARSDVYSLACVLYEMLAGEPPYTAATAVALVAKRLSDPVPSVRRLRPEVPEAVDRALARALARAPADRFARAGDFAAALTAPAPPRVRAVAVLPFVNLSGDAETGAFADGITDDVIAHLAKIRALRVISRTSVTPFRKRERSLREIAARLDATTVLDGSVRRAGDRVRIVAQLVDAAADRQLWAETYDRRLTDIFEIQTDVALQIAAALETELSPDERSRIAREPTRDLEAYRLYLQARQWLARYTHEGMREAAACFERAVARDPDYALAWAGLADALGELVEAGAVRAADAEPRARDALARALRLDPGLSEAHAAAGHLRSLLDFDWAGAEAEYRRAIELAPSNADAHDMYARLCTAVGRYDEALALARRAQELDPLAHRADVSTILVRAGRYAEAERETERVLELEPAHDRIHATRGWALFLQGRTAEGIRELEQAVALAPRNTQWVAQLAQAAARAGDTPRARRLLAELEARAREGYVSPYHFAFVYVGLGERDRALDCLERALAERTGAIFGIRGSFLFAPLRAEPRFAALLAKIGMA